MARAKPTPQDPGTVDLPAGFPASGGSYVADETAGFQQTESLLEATANARRGFGAVEDEASADPVPAPSNAPEA